MPSVTYAHTLGKLKQELNNLEKKDFLQVFVVPPSIEETDEEGFKELASLANGFYIPIGDKVLIEQLVKEMNVKEIPMIIVVDQLGSVVSNSGHCDMVELDLERLRKKWNKGPE